MFNPDFYPTPPQIVAKMLEQYNPEGKTILEPSAGKGDIVSELQAQGGKVVGCENDTELKKILATKCNIIEADFFNLTSDKISHIDAIFMNPPFSCADKHVNHAFEIAPPGCKIIALCNSETIQNTFSRERKILKTTIENNGSFEDLGKCFEDAERKTGVNVFLLTITKPGENKNAEFEGFFMDEEPEEQQAEGLISYNVVRDLVNRYIQACKIYCEVLTVEKRLSNITGSFFGDGLGVQISLSYEYYKKALQKAGWMFILNKMNLGKYTTRGVREDINKFVEQQTNIPFTMRNIYHMLDMVVQTAGQRMDKAILEVFDRVTEHHHDNRHNIKGWKTNSHFLVGKKFILPNIISPAKEYGYTSDCYTSLRSSYDGTIPDFEKALCFVEGINYDEIIPVNSTINRNTYGEWYTSQFFKYKGYKNGNMHFEFISEDVWNRFNKRVAKLKGYALFEGKEQTAYQNRQTGRAYQYKRNPAHQFKPNVMFEVNIKTS